MSHDKFRSMFREYDIRGRVAEDELSLDACRRIIRGFATFLKRRGIGQTVVGFDNRRDSPAYSHPLSPLVHRSTLPSNRRLVIT